MQQVSLNRLMSDTKVARRPLEDLFPDGMHYYIKGGDSREGRYLFRFNNGLGAICFVEAPGLEQPLVIFYISWNSKDDHDTEYRALDVDGKFQDDLKSVKHMNEMLTNVLNRPPLNQEAWVVEPLLINTEE